MSGPYKGHVIHVDELHVRYCVTGSTPHRLSRTMDQPLLVINKDDLMGGACSMNGINERDVGKAERKKTFERCGRS